MTLLLIAGVLMLVGYEVMAVAKQTPGDGPLTISEIIWSVSKRTPFLPFMFGVLMGHLFARGGP